MTTSSSQRAVELFESALELTPPDRATYLESACRAEPALRAEVESLLRADQQAGGFLEPPAPQDQGSPPGIDPLVGSRIGHYQVQRVIAAGGMGTVYEAVQEEPHRTVALKVIRRDITSRSALQRFKHESEILGHLRHPGVAQIYEAGAHGGESGAPFFAMEFIPGARSITRYAAEEQLSVADRITLFTRVCEAVQAGHQRGIIHRDLKPANILVNEQGQPKLIDFGVARATDADLTLATFQTDAGELVGTLRYMSPEQCEGQASLLDTRSDVYALGVVLYELLTGELPYDLSTSSPFDVPRIIREQEPRRLSTFDRKLRGDLETIVLKALEKDREHRYQSVAELMRDLQHYLENEPIHAKRGRHWYVFRKTLRRHRLAAAVIASFVLLICAFAISSFVLYQHSQAEAQTAQQVLNVLNRALVEADPNAGSSGDALLALLDKTAAQLDQKQVKDRKVRATVQRTLGAAYMNLGRYEQGGKHMRAALEAHREMYGDDHVETAESKARYSVWQCATGDLPGAETALREAIPILRQHKAKRRSELARSLGRLAVVMLYQQQPAEGETYAREYLEIAEETPGDPDGDIATAANLVSIMLQEQDRLPDAEPFLRRALASDRERFGNDHPRVGRDLENLGILLRKLGNYEDAESTMREAIRVTRQSYSEETPELAYITQNLANILADEDKRLEAGALHRQAVDIAERQLEDDNFHKASVYATAADFFLRGGEPEEALPLARRAQEIGETSLPPGHPNRPLYQGLTGCCLTALGRFEEAEPLLLGAQQQLAGIVGADDGRTLQVGQCLDDLHEQASQSDEPQEQPGPTPRTEPSQ
jgi:serine/threonine protein kinase/Tfp pilus assembly protein PilF